MAKYDLRNLRREILSTLGYIPYSPFRVKALLNALRPTGFEDLSEISLLGHIKYLEEKGYVKTGMAKNVVTEEEVLLVTLTAQGQDLLLGYLSDVGVACG